MVVFMKVVTFPKQSSNGSPKLTYPNGLPRETFSLRCRDRTVLFADPTNVPQEWIDIVNEGNAVLCKFYRIQTDVPLIRCVMNNPFELEFRNFQERKEFLNYACDRLACYFSPKQVHDEFSTVLQNQM